MSGLKPARRLLALAVAVPAVVLLAAPPASAGCTEDYRDDTTALFASTAPEIVTVSGLDVTVHGSAATYFARPTTNFVNCVV